MLDRGAQRNTGAERVSHDISLLDAEVLDDAGDIVSHRLVSHRAVEGQGVAMRLQVDGDDLVAFSQQGDVGAEHVHGGEPAMQQDDRFALAIDGIIDLDAVDGGVTGLGWSWEHGGSFLVLSKGRCQHERGGRCD